MDRPLFSSNDIKFETSPTRGTSSPQWQNHVGFYVSIKSLLSLLWTQVDTSPLWDKNRYMETCLILRLLWTNMEVRVYPCPPLPPRGHAPLGPTLPSGTKPQGVFSAIWPNSGTLSNVYDSMNSSSLVKATVFSLLQSLSLMRAHTCFYQSPTSPCVFFTPE